MTQRHWARIFWANRAELRKFFPIGEAATGNAAAITISIVLLNSMGAGTSLFFRYIALSTALVIANRVAASVKKRRGLAGETPNHDYIPWDKMSRQLKRATAVGALFAAINTTFLFGSLGGVSGSVAVLTLASTSVLTGFMTLFTKQRSELSLRVLAAMPLNLLGVFLLVSQRAALGVTSTASFIALAISATALSVYQINSRWLNGKGVGPSTRTKMAALFTTVGSGAFCIAEAALGKAIVGSPDLLKTGGLLAGLTLATFMFIDGRSKATASLPAASAAFMTGLGSGLTAVSSWLFLGERLPLPLLIGTNALIVGSTVIATTDWKIFGKFGRQSTAKVPNSETPDDPETGLTAATPTELDSPAVTTQQTITAAPTSTVPEPPIHPLDPRHPQWRTEGQWVLDGSDPADTGAEPGSETPPKPGTASATPATSLKGPSHYGWSSQIIARGARDAETRARKTSRRWPGRSGR